MISMRSRLGLMTGIMLLALQTAWAATWPAESQAKGLTAQKSHPSLARTPFADWTTLRSHEFNAPFLAFGKPVGVPGASVTAALEMVTSAAECEATFELMSQHTILGLTRGYFREMRNGLPVLAGRADVTLNSRGELMRWSLRAHNDWPIAETHLLGFDAAGEVIAEKTDYLAWIVDSERSAAAWFPDAETRTLRPVHWIRIHGERPHERWEGIVDAVSGEILRDWPGIHSDVISGTLQGPYWQPYDFSEPQVAPCVHATVTINGTPVVTDTLGFFSGEAGSEATLMAELRGPYVHAQNDDGADGVMHLSVTTPFAPLTWEWTTTDAVEPELNLFYHTTLIHQWYKALDPAFSALDYPMPAVANYGNSYDNAFWNGYGTYYGAGGQYHNFAMFSDIVYHEYTHGVTDGIYPNGMLPYIDQPGALNEAWSDYFASTINGDPYMAEYIQGVFHSWFRNLENDLVFPRDWFGEVHYDSRFVSAALWEMRQTLGAAITDDLAHYARYALAETFFDYLVAVLETDDDDGDLSNGTPHAAVIYQTFGRHGIGPGSDPNFVIEDLSYYADGTGGSVGDGDRFIEPGETVELVFTLVNDAVLFPPPATDVTITVHSSDSHLSIENGTQPAGTLGPRESFTASPVQIHVNASAPDHWADITISVDANGMSGWLDFELAFSVGTPHLLVVNDDPDTDVERFVTNALREQYRIYDETNPSAGQSVNANLLPHPGMVIWLSGNADGEILTAADRQLLEDYLAAGNRVVLSGQNIADELVQTQFGQNVLQVEIESESLVSFAVTATDSPLESGEWFLATGADGAANQTEETSFVPFGDSRTIAVYGRSGDGPAAAVKFAGERGLLFGFGIEAVSGMGPGSTNLGGLMDRLFAWGDDVLPAESSRRAQEAIPTSAHITAVYPNPFNARTRIEYALPSAKSGEFVVYDLTGRLVESRRLTEMAGVVEWSPRSASGIYFGVVKWEGGASAPVKLLFVR